MIDGILIRAYISVTEFLPFHVRSSCKRRDIRRILKFRNSGDLLCERAPWNSTRRGELSSKLDGIGREIEKCTRTLKDLHLLGCIPKQQFFKRKISNPISYSFLIREKAQEFYENVSFVYLWIQTEAFFLISLIYIYLIRDLLNKCISRP